MGKSALASLRNRGKSEKVETTQQDVQQVVHQVPQQDVQQMAEVQQFRQPVAQHSGEVVDTEPMVDKFVEHEVYSEPVQAQPVQQNIQAQPVQAQPVQAQPVQHVQSMQAVYQQPAQQRGQQVTYAHSTPNYGDNVMLNEEYSAVKTQQNAVEHKMNVIKVNSPVTYSAPDKVGLSVLGVSDPSKVRLLKPAVLDVEPLVLTNIRDTTGSISARLIDIMNKTGCSVLPLRECNVFDSITDIPEFAIIEVRGKKFASYTGANFPTTFMNSLERKITDKILIAQPFGVTLDADTNKYFINPNEAILSRKIQFNGVDVEVPSLCVSQLNYLYAYFRLYNCNVVDVENDFPRLIVGIDLEGLHYDVNMSTTHQQSYGYNSENII